MTQNTTTGENLPSLLEPDYAHRKVLLLHTFYHNVSPIKSSKPLLFGALCRYNLVEFHLLLKFELLV